MLQESTVISERTKHSFEKSRYRDATDVSWTNLLENIRKYATKINRPYQSRHDFLADLAQPLIGIKMIAQGLITAAILPVYILHVALSSFFNDKEENVNNYKNTRALLKNTLTCPLLGAFQILTAPLTWLIKMPIRGIKTFMNGGMERYEDTKHIQRIVKEAEESLNSDNKLGLVTALSLLHDKYNNAHFIKHRNTNNISQQSEWQNFKALKKEFNLGTLNVASKIELSDGQKAKVKNYLNLFLMKPAVENKGTVEQTDQDCLSNVNEIKQITL